MFGHWTFSCILPKINAQSTSAFVLTLCPDIPYSNSKAQWLPTAVLSAHVVYISTATGQATVIFGGLSGICLVSCSGDLRPGTPISVV